MARVNTPNKVKKERTHEGAPAVRVTAEDRLRRTVLACMLWERNFYEDGMDIAERLLDLVPQVNAHKVAALAREARRDMRLRHAPLLLTSALAYHKVGSPIVRPLVRDVVQRADELAELVAVHAHVNGVSPNAVKPILDGALKRGLADAFPKFDGYALAKYNRDGAVKLRDVLFLTHPKPKDEEQQQVWQSLIDGTLSAPDTWEVSLSAGKDKKATFERLLSEGRLGYMALLRNLRNMEQVGVNANLIKRAIGEHHRAKTVLPFRFVAAARHAPRYEKELDKALQAQIDSQNKLSGTTVILVDVSASMNWGLSSRSDMRAMDAAATLASVVPAEDTRVLTFSNEVVEVPPRSGMAGVDAVIRSQRHGGTRLGNAVHEANKLDYDRLIVITDEQSHDPVPAPKGTGYMINVSANRNGVGYGKWVHIDGFSEAVIKYIQTIEQEGVV